MNLCFYQKTNTQLHPYLVLFVHLGQNLHSYKKYMYEWKITSLTNVLTKPQSSSCIFRSLGVKKQPWPIGVGLLGSKLTNLLPWLADFPPINFKLKLHFQSKFFGAVFKNMFPEHMKFQCWFWNILFFMWFISVSTREKENWLPTGFVTWLEEAAG